MKTLDIKKLLYQKAITVKGNQLNDLKSQNSKQGIYRNNSTEDINSIFTFLGKKKKDLYESANSQDQSLQVIQENTQREINPQDNLNFSPQEQTERENIAAEYNDKMENGQNQNENSQSLQMLQNQTQNFARNLLKHQIKKSLPPQIASLCSNIALSPIINPRQLIRKYTLNEKNNQAQAEQTSKSTFKDFKITQSNTVLQNLLKNQFQQMKYEKNLQTQYQKLYNNDFSEMLKTISQEKKYKQASRHIKDMMYERKCRLDLNSG